MRRMFGNESETMMTKQRRRSWGGRGGAGVLIIKAPLAVTATFAVPGPQAPYATNYAHGSHRYFIVQGEGGTNPVPGTVVFS